MLAHVSVHGANDVDASAKFTMPSSSRSVMTKSYLMIRSATRFLMLSISRTALALFISPDLSMVELRRLGME